MLQATICRFSRPSVMLYLSQFLYYEAGDHSGLITETSSVQCSDS